MVQQYLDLSGVHLTRVPKQWTGGVVGSGSGGRRQAGFVTFDLQFGGVPDLCGRIAGHTCEVARVPWIETRNAEKARIGVKGWHVDAQRRRQRLPVLEPGDHQRLVPGTYAANSAGSHALGQSVLEGKGLNNGRNWEREEKQTSSEIEKKG